MQKRGTVMEHVEIEIGLGRFEAFTSQKDAQLCGTQHLTTVANPHITRLTA